MTRKEALEAIRLYERENRNDVCALWPKRYEDLAEYIEIFTQKEKIAFAREKVTEALQAAAEKALAFGDCPECACGISLDVMPESILNSYNINTQIK